MKNTLFISAALFACFQLNAQNGALIEFKIASSKGPTGNCVIQCSEAGAKTEFNMQIPQMPGGGMHSVSLMNNDNPDVIFMINDQAKTYSEMKKTDGKDDNKTYTAKKIGEEKMNGYMCTHALITEGTETIDVWTTKAFPEYDKYEKAFASNKRVGSAKRQQALKDAGCDGFPVKTIHKGNGREGDMTMDLVKFDKKSYAKSDFDLPAGYTKSDTSSGSQVKSQQEIMSMSPEERAKYLDEMKKQYGKKE